ncbi:hypothetical protein QBC40DRAFT_261097 [Triangularia verruculosa]|uniref:NmrA-like domain-containing protein n=1 Tax=Triangularia verruculosa TaxID=2587418 RepID=A0AAN6XQQ2_9PEZI|nr:hypothetical protein QBC40DRAFT_261097 [Triangularia verruculosa]
MVKIAVAAPGQVAREITEVLVATGKHEVITLARRDLVPEEIVEGTTPLKVDFHNKDDLAKALRGVHTVLSFVVAQNDPEATAQKTLIDASIAAGVKRFAPSEWFVARFTHLKWNDSKLLARDYLEEVNKNGKVLEYCLFQPGLFTDYHANENINKHLKTNDFLPIDFANRRLLAPGSLEPRFTATTIQDVGNIVAKAIEYEGEWPKIGGIAGETLSLAQELAIGEKIRGKKFDVELLDLDSLRRGEWNGSWVKPLDHPSVQHLDEETRAAFSRAAFSGFLLALAEGDMVVSDEWNRIFPDYKFTGVEEFVSNFWVGRP